MSNDPAAIARRNKYVEDNLDLVDKIARYIRKVKRLPPCFDIEDLKQCGALGLIDAAGKYDPSRGVPFRLYAKVRIRGEIMESVRRRRYKDATCEELDTGMGHDGPGSNVVAIDGAIRAKELAGKIARAMAALGETDRKVLDIYYVRQERLAGVGREFGVKQSRSSQLLQAAYARLRYELAAQGVSSLAA
jgi:RNA polymerase sigma factor (sigma-70 family)